MPDLQMPTDIDYQTLCRYQDVDKISAITKSIRLHLETNLGVDQRLPLGTCLTVRCHCNLHYQVLTIRSKHAMILCCASPMAVL